MTINKPNLFIIGASKCGTTSLWHMLNLHPNVFMSNPKEPWFFSFSSWKDNIQWYERLFENATTEKILGEASPIYSETTLIPELPNRIYQYNPKAKIIFIVREPIDRLKSVWKQTLSTGHWYKNVIANYTDVEVPLMPKELDRAIFEYPPFLEACKYFTHYNNYKKYFEDENILLLFFDDLKDNPKTVYRSMCKFLGIVPQKDEQIFRKQNDGTGKQMDYKFLALIKKNKTVLKFVTRLSTLTGIRAPRKRISYEVEINKPLKNKINSILEKEKASILKLGDKPSDFWDS